MGIGPKTNLQSQNATKTARRAVIENLEKELTQYDNLAFLVILFFNSASMASSSGESSRVTGSASPRMGRSNWLATSSRVTVSSPQEKKKVWVVVHHRRTKQWDETMAFKTLACCNNPMKPVSDNSLSTHSLQPKAVPDPNSKWMGTGSKMPWRMTRSGIEEANWA